MMVQTSESPFVLTPRAEKFVENLLSTEAYEQPSDPGKVEDVEMKLPEWFDERKYNQGRRFYNDFIYMLIASMTSGLIAVFSIPSILNVLVDSRRSSSVYTAYKRYFSTHKHVTAWFEHDLKPGSVSWRSLYTVRCRHIQAGRAAKIKGSGMVSQRDMALTLFGFIGFVFLKPDKFSVRQLKEGDWEAYNHCWRVIGHMIGLEDRYNICQNTYEETRQVCQVLQDRVFTPCLTNVPEYFEHMSHVMINGLRVLMSDIEATSAIFATKYLADVPGYVYTEQERIDFQYKLRKHQENESDGVPSSVLVQENIIEGVFEKPHMLYIRDYNRLDDVPAYKRLPFIGKYKLAFNSVAVAIHATDIGRIIINYRMKFLLFIARYLPYVALYTFGIKAVYVNMFKESPTDNTPPKPNSEYYKAELPRPWYKVILSLW